MTQPAAETATSYDLWDEASPTMWFLHIDPDTLEGLWSEEQPTLYINKDELGYWLGEPGVMGQGQYPTLDAAKAAGDEVALRAERDLPGKMLKDAGLDPSAWSFEYAEGARFINREEPSLVVEIDIESANRANRFAAYSADEEVGEYASAAEAADALVNRPAPGL